MSPSPETERRRQPSCRARRSVAAFPRLPARGNDQTSRQAGKDLLLEIEDLYVMNYGRFVRVAMSITGDREAARDVVQDAFASVIRNRHHQRVGSLEGWVWRIVVNTARSERRRERYARKTEERLCEAMPNPGIDQPADYRLTRLIAQLPERQRTVLFLRYFADLGYEQIAEALMIRSGTVGATLAAAHASLRSALGLEQR